MNAAKAARRGFLTVLAAAITAPAATRAAALPAPAQSDLESIKAAAKNLAAAMEKRHGDRWIAQVDHQVGVVLIRPLFDQKGGAL